MGWGSNSWLRCTPETSYGVFNSGGTPLWIRLASDSAFDMIPMPQRYAIRSADGGNRRVQNVTSRTAFGGKLATPLYPVQAATLLGWASTIVSGDLASWTLDFFDSQEVRRYVGTKVMKASVSCSAESNEGVLGLSLDLVAQQLGTAPTLAQPAFTVFPTSNPYTHQMSAGGFTIASTGRVAFNTFSFSVANMLKPTWDELAYITGAPYCGRDVDFSTSFQFLTTADRAVYEGQTASAVSIAWHHPGASKTLTANFAGNVIIAKRNRTLPLGDIAREAYDYEAFIDPATVNDFSFTEA